MSADAAPARARTMLWHDERVRAVLFQLLVLACLAAFVAYFASNAITNLRRAGIASGYGFLDREAGFGISTALISYTPADSYARALLVGFLNTLLVSALGIVFATVIGLAVGIARLSRNWLISRLALVYVEAMRNTPLLLQIFVWWDVLRLAAPGPRQAWHLLPGVFVSNRGLVFPVPVWNTLYGWVALALALGGAGAWTFAGWVRRREARIGPRLPVWLAGFVMVIAPAVAVFLGTGAPLALDVPHLAGFNFRGGASASPEFAALVAALSVYTGAFIGEIVRSGIEAVPRGQSEAAFALGLRRGKVLRLVVLPQAVRVMIPPTTSEYLNLTKNSSLAVAIGFPELFSVGGTTINQTGQPIEVMSIIVAIYLSLSLMTSLAMNLYNRRRALVER